MKNDIKGHKFAHCSAYTASIFAFQMWSWRHLRTWCGVTTLGRYFSIFKCTCIHVSIHRMGFHMNIVQPYLETHVLIN